MQRRLITAVVFVIVFLPVFVVEYPFWPSVSGREFFALHNQGTLFSTAVATPGQKAVMIVPGARDAN